MHFAHLDDSAEVCHPAEVRILNSSQLPLPRALEECKVLDLTDNPPLNICRLGDKVPAEAVKARWLKPGRCPLDRTPMDPPIRLSS